MVKVSDLFKAGLTVPEHETRDLHYIGEALPVPSLITSSISVEADANTGTSPIPAREDHVHAVDVEQLIQFINDNEETIDLTNYYTKSEVDALIDAVIVGDIGDIYYTKDEVDAFILSVLAVFDDYYTKAEIDALLLGLYDADFFAFEKDFSYGTVVAPDGLATLGRIDVFRTFRLTEVQVTLAVASSTDYVIKIWQQIGGSGGFSVVNTTTITASNLYESDVLSIPITFDFGDQYLVTLDAEVAGDGEILVVELRGFYDE